MNKIRLSLFLGILFLIISCDLLRDSPYEVEAWTPGEGFHMYPGKIEISLLLSHNSDRVKAEQAFLMTEDRKTLKGNFSWEGYKLIFTPASPLEADRDYVINLGTGAQDLKGLSLESKFEASFTTRPPGNKLQVIGTEPDFEGNLYGSRGEIRVLFTDPVNNNSCLDHISFNPSTPGSWRLEDENRTACFVPREPWQAGAIYKIIIDKDFASVSGSIIGTEYSSVFFAGDDREKPCLLKAFARFPGLTTQDSYAEEITIEKPGAFPEPAYGAWENNSRLELVFSEPVDLSGLRNLLAVEPSRALVMDSPPEMSERALFRFAECPLWGSNFLFRLSPGVKDNAGNESGEEYIFRISCSGPLSKPPSLVGIRLPMAPGDDLAEYEPLSFSLTDIFEDLPIENGEGKYPYMKDISSWVELYFDTAPETNIDLISVMDLFHIESTNHAITFSPRSVVADGFTWANPAPGWEEFQRIEIRGFFTNTVQSGVVSFRIPAGLRDKRGNLSTEDFRISLLK